MTAEMEKIGSSGIARFETGPSTHFYHKEASQDH
jgi:hypothetical protein